MHLRLSEDEFATLIDMVSLAAEVASLNQKPGAEDNLESFADLEDKILERAKTHGFGEIIEIDPETQKNRVTAVYQTQSYIQECIDEMRNEIFWDEFTFRLAERDLLSQASDNSYQDLSEKEKIALITPRQKNYWKNFVKNGLNQIHLIAPHDEG